MVSTLGRPVYHIGGFTRPSVNEVSFCGNIDNWQEGVEIFEELLSMLESCADPSYAYRTEDQFAARTWSCDWLQLTVEPSTRGRVAFRAWIPDPNWSLEPSPKFANYSGSHRWVYLAFPVAQVDLMAFVRELQSEFVTHERELVSEDDGETGGTDNSECCP